MSEQKQSVSQLAQEVYDAIYFDHAEQCHKVREDEHLQWVHHIVMGGADFSDYDTRVQTIDLACRDLSELEDDATDEEIDHVAESVEPDIYTQELALWLSKDVLFVHYIGDAV